MPSRTPPRAGSARRCAPARCRPRTGCPCRCAAADVGAVADDDALADPALDHRGAQRAGVEVDEALVHDRRPDGEVGSQAHPVGVGDPHAGGHDVVDHAGELVDAEDLSPVPDAAAGPGVLETLDRTRPVVGPDDVGQHEDALEVDRVGLGPGGARAGAGAGRRRRCRSAASRGRSARARRRTAPDGTSSDPGESSQRLRCNGTLGHVTQVRLGNQVSSTVPLSVMVARIGEQG
jgi:hypothetical protein